ncbi:MAG: zinc metallopeptidase [bacterium]|nr:zinc metallopeptidase [bacterium]
MFDVTFMLLIPVFIFALWAQYRVKSTYAKYLRVPAARGLTGQEAARRLLDAGGLSSVGIERIAGELTDHYDPRKRVLRLSDANFDGRSVAALGVACHEAGHALQHARGYVPLQIRQAIWPVAGFGSTLAMPLFFIGFLFHFPVLMDVGILVYAVAAVFTLVTLPVEFDASHRAVQLLTTHGIVSTEERGQVSAVLNAAALTYVAAALMAVTQLIRLLLLRGRR